MKTPVRRRVALLAAAVSLSLTAACGGGGGATGNEEALAANGEIDLSKVTLKVGDQKGVSSRAMLEAAGLADTPYKIEWSQFTSGPPMLEALASGSVHTGTVGNTPPIFAAASGADFKVVAASYYTAEGDAIVVPKGSPITSVEDLKGKQVAVAPGSSANYNLLGQLDKVGLSLQDVDVAELQPADALAALTSGKVDAWASWEPYTSQVQVDHGATPIVTGENGVMNGLNFSAASDEALDDPATTAALKDYITRIQKAQIWTGKPENRTAWAKAWAEGSGLSLDILKHANNARPVEAVPITDKLIATEQEMADAFAEAGELPEKVDLSSYFTDEFNDVATGPAVTGK